MVNSCRFGVYFKVLCNFFLYLELPPLEFRFLTSSLAVSAPWLYWPPRERGRLSNMLRLFWGVGLRGLLSAWFFPLYSFLLPPRPNWRRAEPSPENKTNSYRLHILTAIQLSSKVFFFLNMVAMMYNNKS